jgi:hypothetical protein
MAEYRFTETIIGQCHESSVKQYRLRSDFKYTQHTAKTQRITTLLL